MTYGWPLPGSLVEAGNGVSFVLFGFMTASAALYFLDRVQIVTDVADEGSRWELLKRVYIQAKASWAAALVFLGMFIRTGDVWWVRHVQNHGGSLGWFSEWATPILVFSGLLVIWGAICWMRSVLPLKFGPWAWLFVATSAVAFGIWMAF